MYTLDKQLEIEHFCLDNVAAMVEFLRVKYQIPDFDVRVKMDFSSRRNRSWGGRRNGKNFISLCLKNYLTMSEIGTKMNFVEYASFNDDIIIGGIYYTHWKKALSALIAHELAHAAQFSDVGGTIAAGNNYDSKDSRGHGIVWKKIYMGLRRNFVNFVEEFE